MGQSDFNSNTQKLHPKQQANCLSNLFFCWTFNLLTKTSRSALRQGHLSAPLPQHESSLLGDKLEQAWKSELASSKTPSLWRPLCKTFGGQFMAIGVIVSINEFVVKLSQPVSLWKLIETLTVHHDESQVMQAYFYAFLLVVSSFIKVMLLNWHRYMFRELSLKIKIACSSLIYRKTVRLDKNNVKKTATGRVVNLLSNDLNRFDTLLVQMHHVWVAPVQLVVVLCLVYVMVDASGTVGVVVFVLFIPVQIVMGKKYSELRLKTASKTDERVRLTNEILSGIQVVKMYTWEDLFVGFVNTLRREEMHHIRATAYLKAVQNALNKFLSKGAIYSCILLHVLTGNHLQSQYVFVLKSFYDLLRQSMTTDFPEAIKNISESLVTVNRIEQFLLCDEITAQHTGTKESQDGITLEKLSAKWVSAPRDTLSEISFAAGAKELVTIVGPVGSGKTSLIKVLLQELPPHKGEILVKGRISYACQEPWLFGGTLKENILFGEALDREKYIEVVKVCALEKDFDVLPYGDNSIVGDRGITLSGGQRARINLARAVYRNADIYILDDPLSAVDASVGRQLFDQCIRGYLQEKCVVLATHQVQYLDRSDKIYVLKNGKIVAEGNYQHIYNNCEDLAHKETEFEDSLDADSDQTLVQTGEDERFSETNNSGKISPKVYQQYLLSNGWWAFSVLILVFVLSQTVQSGADYFESFWVKLDENLDARRAARFWTQDNCVYIYTALMVLTLVLSIVATTSFTAYFTRTAEKLHELMFTAVVKGTLQFFFTNPSGCVLNRLSKDMGAADTNVPKYLLDTLQCGLSILAALLLVAVVNPWMLISSAILLSLFYYLRTLYLATSREIKRIEASSRSPVYSHLNESIEGLETIRTFNAEAKQKRQFDQLMNTNTSASYANLALYTAFGLWLSLLCSAYVALVTAGCFWGRQISGSDLGLIITQAMSLSDLFQLGILQWSEFENEMISVERITQYTDIAPEEETGVAETWPQSSAIQFRAVTLKYKEDAPAALNELSFTVAPREKIGVVGRTGAGKTSIISALFRLVKFEGDVVVGGTNTKNVPLRSVRSNISIIPQDPVLFSGTVRNNLDPFNQFSDSELWTILEDLDLKSFVAHLPAGLHSQILEKGSNLSVGQRQMFCLARALLKKNKILVLDEATASVDLKTDSLIQTTIKNKLEDCTVLIIAHRLHTIMDCDKVLVMDAGRSVEYDHPYRLLQNKNGFLYSLVQKTGQGMNKHLTGLAKKNFYESTRL